MTFASIKDIDLKGRKVLLRADLNVPRQDGRITDTTRIDRVKPTIDYLRAAGARVLVLSHFGRPEGEAKTGLSLAFLTTALQERWGCEVSFATDCIGAAAEQASDSLNDGDVVLLENLRFHKGETANDPEFVNALAALGDLYVNDAFSTAHRAHASTEGLAHVLPAAAGLLMSEELNALDQALGNPDKPVAALAGGSKISTKISVLVNLVNKVDYLILGGGMANTFIHAQGGNIGGSLCEHDMTDTALEILDNAKKAGCEIILPRDFVAVDDIKQDAPFEICPADAVPGDKKAIDTGPDSTTHITEILSKCKTIVWNGPMGVFEIKPFDSGTNSVARHVAEQTKAGKIISIAGGGDTVAALENAGVISDFSYISTAGGAFLEWLEGKTLPGVAALSNTTNETAQNLA